MIMATIRAVLLFITSKPAYRKYAMWFHAEAVWVLHVYVNDG